VPSRTVAGDLSRRYWEAQEVAITNFKFAKCQKDQLYWTRVEDLISKQDSAVVMERLSNNKLKRSTITYGMRNIVSSADPNFASSDTNNCDSRCTEALPQNDWVQGLARLCTLFTSKHVAVIRSRIANVSEILRLGSSLGVNHSIETKLPGPI
jgi:hypothetical protein